MPEGDSLRIVAASLRPLVGKSVEAGSPHPRGRVTGVAAAVDGRVLEEVEAVGKNLLLRFDGGVVVRSHLRLTGRWFVGRPEERRRGDPWLVLRAGEVEATLWNGPVLEIAREPLRHLGPDILAETFDSAVAARRVGAQGTRVLGEVLVDQRIVAGIGNRWMAEVLWHAQVSPFRPCGTIEPTTLAALLAWTHDAMRESIISGRRPARAYGRSGRPCGRCGGPIRSSGLGEHNRRAYWCPACQPSD